MTRIRNEKMTNISKTNESLGKLSDVYYKEAERLEAYIDKLKDEIKSRPEPDKLYTLEKRLEILRSERRELLSTALQLSKLASPPPAHPSILHREREAS